MLRHRAPHRFTAVLFAAALCAGSAPVHALRPQLDRSGVEQELSAAGAEDRDREDWIRWYIAQRRGRKRRAGSGGSISWANQPTPPDPGPFPWTRPPALPSPPKSEPKKPEPPKKIFPHGLNPARWPERVRGSLSELHKKGIIAFPVPGGMALLFLRRGPSLDPEILLDLLLSFDGAYYPIGRLDLKLDLRTFDAMVKGPASAQFLFGKEAQEYINLKGVARNNVTGFNPFTGSRKDPWDMSGMQIWYNVLKQLELNEEEARQALLFTAAAYLQSYYSGIFFFSADDKDYANAWLAKFLRGIPGSLAEEDDIPSAKLDLVLKELESRLTLDSFDPVLAGMEDSEESRRLHRIEIRLEEAEILSSV